LMLPLIAADLTTRSGYLNFAIGWFGLASGLGATLSTVVAGGIADALGTPATFVCLAAAGAVAVALLSFAMPETHPDPDGPSGGAQENDAKQAALQA
jgi:MFS family permease